MGITSRSRKPNEWAAKVNHTHIINDPVIKQFLNNCSFPKEPEPDGQEQQHIYELNTRIDNPIRHILAVDGGYTITEVKKNLPSSQIAFFQFGAVLFKVEDLEKLSAKSFIDTEDIQKLHNLQRFKLALPLRNIAYLKEASLKNSIRRTIYDFFMEQRDDSSFMETLSWFIFNEYNSTQKDSYTLASDPNSDIGSGKLVLKKSDMDKKAFTFDDSKIYLTDVFRLHEVIDEDHGAEGLLGYVTRLIEQLILVHFIRIIYRRKKEFLKEFMFIADGPLSFAGQTANMHNPMRELCNYLKKDHHLYLAGIEKSGPFVDHALNISSATQSSPILPKGKYMLLSNDYIYKHVTPGDSEKMLYGSYSYYGAKVIFHSADEQILVVSVPVPNKDTIRNPKKTDYANLAEILINIQKLRCNMYDDSIVPIVLVNKLVSLANHPSQVLLEKFAQSAIDSS